MGRQARNHFPKEFRPIEELFKKTRQRIAPNFCLVRSRLMVALDAAHPVKRQERPRSKAPREGQVRVLRGHGGAISPEDPYVSAQAEAGENEARAKARGWQSTTWAPLSSRVDSDRYLSPIGTWLLTNLPPRKGGNSSRLPSCPRTLGSIGIGKLGERSISAANTASMETV